jgi:hypothetical protein
MRNSDFFCVNIHVAEKAVWKSRYCTYRDNVCSQNELCLEPLDIVSVSTYIDVLLTLMQVGL